MGQLTPSFLFDLESNMRTVSANEYQRLTANTWWDKVAKRMSSGAKKERISWLLDTAKIVRPNATGQQVFDDMVMRTTEFENESAVAGLILKKEQIEDLDGNGVQLATSWSRQIGAQGAYWPQKVVSAAIKANPLAYDGVAFFATNHPVNPFDTGAGVFANRFTGSASGAYPGALPIDASVTVEVALNNLARMVAYMAGIKMPNGVDPRGLRPMTLMVPPALMARATLLTNAKFLAQSAASGAISGDVAAVVTYLGLGQPVQCDELGAAFGGSDTTYYVTGSEIGSDELGAFVYIERTPFQVDYHGPMSDAQLARTKEFQWTCEGRNTVGAGHPYLMFRCDAT